MEMQPNRKFRVLEEHELDTVAGGLARAGGVTPFEEKNPTDPDHPNAGVTASNPSPGVIEISAYDTTDDGVTVSTGADINVAANSIEAVVLSASYSGTTESVRYDLSSGSFTGTISHTFSDGNSVSAHITAGAGGNVSIGGTATFHF